MSLRASETAAEASSYPFASTRGPAIRKRWFPIIGLLIVVLSTVLQLGCINHALVIDDFQLVQNVENGRGCGRDPIACFSGKLFGLYYRPMLTASFAIVQRYHIHDDNPRWFHIENLLLHAIVVALALCLFRLILRRRTVALVATALFALHPVQVGVTTFIGGRTDTLALMFLLTFAIGVTKAGKLFRVAHRRVRAGRGAVRVSWIILSAVAFLAAIFTKEQVIPLVLLTPLLLRPRQPFVANGRSKRPPRGNQPAGSHLPFWLTIYLVPITIYTIASGRVLKGDKLPHVDWSLGRHIEMVGRTLWYFAKTLFVPTITTLHQSTLGPWDVPQYFVAALGYLCAAIWLTVLVRVWPNRNRRFMALWATLTLVTCVNLVPIPSTFASPYRAAIPLFGMAGLIGGVLVDLPETIRRRYPTAASPSVFVCALFVGCVVWCISTSVDDVPMWQDETALMKAEVAADPNYVPARAALANYFAAQQPPDSVRSLSEYNICISELFGKSTPESDYAAVIKTPQMLRSMQSASGPRYTVDYIVAIFRCRGWDFQTMSNYTEAIADYKVALGLAPGDSLTSQNLANCYRLLGGRLLDVHNYAGAIVQFRLGLTANADDRYVRDALIAAYRMVGEKGKADAVFRMEDRFTGKVP